MFFGGRNKGQVFENFLHQLFWPVLTDKQFLLHPPFKKNLTTTVFHWFPGFADLIPLLSGLKKSENQMPVQGSAL